MLQITVPQRNYFNQDTQEFLTYPSKTLTLEHSLISISKWESKWKKPFLSTDNKTYEETIDYIKCMTLNPGVGDDAYIGLTKDIFAKINAYIDDPMTASTISGRGNHRPSRQIVTSELIYYWMISLEIPFECQKWHLNRLLMLIRICEAKNNPGKKMSKKEVYQQYRALNEARKKRTGSKG